MSKSRSDKWVALAGFLAWIVPGAGHWYIGQRAHAVILFTAIHLTYWFGIAISGFSIFEYAQNRWWFLAHLLGGINGLIGWYAEANWQGIATAYGKSWDVGNIYCGVAGLLNLLVVIDAMARTEEHNTTMTR